MKIRDDKKQYVFYNHMSLKRNIRDFITIYPISKLLRDRSYVCIGLYCYYNTFQECYIDIIDLHKYKKLQKTNKDIFDREWERI